MSQAANYNATVLVVDDAPDSLSYINDILDQVGIDCLLALDGSKALKIADKITPDLILLDALMPGLDGFETCKIIKATPALADIPVIFMTGLSDTDDVLKGLDAGATDYLTKPVNPKELLARMQVHLRSAQRSINAYKALESAGQSLFRTRSDGDIIWSTPQTMVMLSQVDDYKNWIESVVSPIIKQWLSSSPTAYQQVKFDNQNYKFSAALIAYEPSGSILLKLNDLSENTGEQMLQDKLSLTARESEVLYWLAAGKTNKDISEILNISPRTVNKHLEQVFPKLGVENRTAAAAIAIRALS